MKPRIIRISTLLFAFAAIARPSAGAKLVSNYGPASDRACGIDIVAKANAFREKKDYAQGEAYLQEERQSRESTLTTVWEQGLDMARFALYRDDSTKEAEMDALLKRVLARGETTFWGTAALGWLNVRGKAPITVYWPWRKGQLVAPETTVVYGVDKAFRDGGNYAITLSGDAPLAVKSLDLVGVDGQTVAHLPSLSVVSATHRFTATLPAATVTAIRISVDGENLPSGKFTIARQIARTRSAVPFAGLDLPRSIVGDYIRRTVGDAALTAIGSKDGGAAFLSQFFADRDWMEQFAGSGPWSCSPWEGMKENLPNAAKALAALETLVANDRDGFILGTRLGRNVATALALNHGFDKDDDWLVDVLGCYRAWAREDSLIPETRDYDVREWREVVGFGQNIGLSVDDLRWCHGFVTKLEPSDCHGLCWQCSYRTFNCFGEDVQGPHYYRVWQHRMTTQELRYYVGGVCGALSKFGSHIAAAHGVRSFTAGQPMHCAYLVWDYARSRWDIAYSVTGHTGPHNSLGGAGFAAANEQQRYYAHPQRLEAERLRWQGRYEEAMRRVPGNWTAAVAWYNELERNAASPADWSRYGKAVRETFRDMPSEAWQLYWPYVRRLADRDARLAAACKGLKTIVESPTDDVEAAYFDEIALSPLKKLFNKDDAAVWTAFESALQGQAATKTFYRQTISWGAANLIGDEASSRRFMAAIRHSVEQSGAALDYRDMLVTASRNGDSEMYAQVYSLLDKCSPELKSKPSGKTWPVEKDGARLLSADGMLMTSSTSRWDAPTAYRNALSSTGYAEKSPFHTGRENAPWAMVKLPGPAEVKAVTIVNSGELGNEQRQVPLVVWTSEDGKTFTKITSFAQAESEWQVRLDAPVKARYVKVGREENAKNEFFHLHKILVYGKKLY